MAKMRELMTVKLWEMTMARLYLGQKLVMR